MSEWRTSTSSTGTPSFSATIIDHDVSWACPWGVVPVTTSTFPVGVIRMVADSHPPATAPRAAMMRDGARPQISM